MKFETEIRQKDIRAKRILARFVGIILIIAGLLLFAALLRYQLRLIVFGTKAVGQVRTFEQPPRRWRRPVVRVTLADGKAIEFYGASMKNPHVAVGDIVPVYYLPQEPPFGEIATFRRFWLTVMISPLLIIVSLGGGIWILRAGSGWFRISND